MLHLYCGNGKGKTTAAIGLAIRMSGYKKKILFVSFLKDGNSGEQAILKTLSNITLLHTDTPEMFFFQMDPKQKADFIQKQRQLFTTIVEQMDAYDACILDEALDALHLQILQEKEVQAFLNRYKAKKEIVLTGRNPDVWLCELADYHTHFEMIKHPYTKGITAREGIEY